MNILDYIKTNDKTFAEAELNNVDALIFTTLAYGKLEQVEGINLENPGTVKEFYKFEFFRDMFCDSISDSDNMMAWVAAAAGRRFRDIKVKNVEAKLDVESEMQFAVMTFEIADDLDFVAFRGTDGTMIGWKEDFNLAFSEEVPAHRMAVDYLNRHYGQTPPAPKKSFFKKVEEPPKPKRVLIGGHSKGGNLAFYGGLKANDIAKACVKTIYGFDNPGFLPEVSDELMAANEEVGIELLKFAPQESVIGMLLKTEVPVKIVESSAVFVEQHAGCSWQVDGDDFVYVEELSLASKALDKATDDMIREASVEQRKDMVDGFFSLLDQGGIKTVSDLQKINVQKAKELLNLVKTLEPEQRTHMEEMLKMIVAFSVSRATNEIRNIIISDEDIETIKSFFVKQFGSQSPEANPEDDTQA